MFECGKFSAAATDSSCAQTSCVLAQGGVGGVIVPGSEPRTFQEETQAPLAVTLHTHVKRTATLCPISAPRQQYAPGSGPDLAAQRTCFEPCLRMQVFSLGRPFYQTNTATTP